MFAVTRNSPDNGSGDRVARATGETAGAAAGEADGPAALDGVEITTADGDGEGFATAAAGLGGEGGLDGPLHAADSARHTATSGPSPPKRRARQVLRSGACMRLVSCSRNAHATRDGFSSGLVVP